MGLCRSASPRTGFSVMPVSLEHLFMQCSAYYLIQIFLDLHGDTNNVQLFGVVHCLVWFGRGFFCLSGISRKLLQPTLKEWL